MVKRSSVFLLIALVSVASFSMQTLAEGESIEESGVAAILSRRCLSCHNNADHKGEFSLQTQESFEESGVVAPGDSAASHLLVLISSSGGSPPSMPKDSDPLTKDEINIIQKWIEQGANWPEGFELEEPIIENYDWWSFQSLKRGGVPELPASTSPDWLKNPIDAFILRKQIANGLTPSPPAEKRILIRRLTYDLTGLPPTPAEIDAFVGDESPDAYLRLVDRLLDSPAYGEHWARHWLDVVKYADTCGYDKDKLRNNAWPYRDYVIRAFNEDKPYSRFIQEQLAGDALFPGEADGILGLGFLAAGPWDFIGHVEVPEAKLDGKVARNLDRDDMVSNAINTFCSVTIQCARCHNHKFDPFTQEHYYSLQTIFAAVDRAERPYDLDPDVEQERRELESELALAKSALDKLQKEITTAGGEELKKLNAEVTSLTRLVEPHDKKPAYGYHSQIAKSSETPKWVQIDLGARKKISEIVLHACHDDYAGIGAGFGFPKSYRIEGANSLEEFQSENHPELQVKHEQQFQSNPGLKPIHIAFPGQSVRYLRITATQLAERKNDYIFALAELEVRDELGENVALNAKVVALDSIEAPVRWSKNNLTDGIWAKSKDPEAEEKLALAIEQKETLLKKIHSPQRQQRQTTLKAQIEKLGERLQALPNGKMVYAAATHFKPQGNFKPTKGVPRLIHLLHRGNIGQPKQVVKPGVLPLQNNAQWKLTLPENHQEAERRAAFAKWVSDKQNPLTWRSIVNRVWQFHFGDGLVSSPNDFGRMGQLPSHPELLDWLAVEFRDRGESFKKLHRLIVTSATYQQTSAHQSQNARIDGSNRMLWRMNRQRLSAEEIRDSILFVSGQLDRSPGGPGDQLFVLEHPQHSPHYEYHLFDPSSAKRHRRSIYRFVVRSQPDPWMSVLDCADSSQSTPKRSETLTALQALSMMNNQFNLVMAERFAARLEGESVDVTQQIQRGFRLATGRSPTMDEQAKFMEYTEEYGLQNCCRLFLNLSEFMFVD